ncbi:MAG: hypothetical protein NTV00_03410 [Methylococcales bacterium]|nr:hypothetical protein [Methylococcales bacterium]
MQKIILNKFAATKDGTPHLSNTQKIAATDKTPTWLVTLTPWMAGVGIAVGHALTSSNCSIPKQGSCSACGSCVVALGSLTAWAVIKQRSNEQPFYEQTTK